MTEREYLQEFVAFFLDATHRTISPQTAIDLFLEQQHPEDFDVVGTRIDPWVWTEKDHEHFAEFYKWSPKKIDTE
jgi:hypothetical protein